MFKNIKACNREYLDIIMTYSNFKAKFNIFNIEVNKSKTDYE
jgi:hypothetical protein